MSDRHLPWRTRVEAVRPARAEARREPHESRPLPSGERDFRRELTRRLELLQRESESLRVRVERLPRESSTEYLEMLGALRIRADRLEHQVSRYVRGGAETWETFRRQSEDTWGELKRSLLRIALLIHRRHPEMELRVRSARPRR
jgi:hypothetical protein